jgi:pantoate--beta-alanine ligase
MSSRNKYLSDRLRAMAPVLYRSLLAAQAALNAGERDAIVLRALIYRIISADPDHILPHAQDQSLLPEIDYISIADPVTLAELDIVDDGALVSLAVFFGKTRLIDNLIWKTYDSA